jgi:predicted metal-dependent hydrolase
VRLSGVVLRRRVVDGGRPLTYNLRFADTSRLSISVHPDLSVSAIAPFGVDAEAVDARVHRRLPWITRQQLRFEQYHPLPAPRRYVGGETHLYLGRQYRLRFRRGPDGVRLLGRYLWVSSERPATAWKVEALLNQWYRARAPEVFARRLAGLQSRAPWLRVVSASVLRVRMMTHRWGSCTPAGNILLNPELVKAPVGCIDYVLAHELCHLRAMDHSPRFVRLLGSLVPDWERARKKLNTFGR